MNEELLKSIWQNLGGEQVGNFEGFVDQFVENEDLQKSAWQNLGGEEVGTFDSFIQSTGIGSNNQNPNDIVVGESAEPIQPGTPTPNQIKEETQNTLSELGVTEEELASGAVNAEFLGQTPATSYKNIKTRFKNNPAYQELEEETGLLNSIWEGAKALGSTAVDLFTFGVPSEKPALDYSFERFDARSAKRNNKIKELQTRARNEVFDQITPEDIQPVSYDEMYEETVNEDRNRVSDEVLDITNQRLKDNKKILNDYSEYQYDKLTKEEKDIFEKFMQTNSLPEGYEPSPAMQNLVQSQIKLFEQNQVINNTVDKYKNLGKNISQVVAVAKDNELSDDEIRQQVISYLDSEDVQKQYSSPQDQAALNQLKKRAENFKIYDTDVTEAWGGTTVTFAESMTEIYQSAKNLVGLGDKAISAEDALVESQLRSLDETDTELVKSFVGRGGTAEQGAIIEDVVRNGDFNYIVDTKTNMVTGMRDAKTGASIPIFKPFTLTSVGYSIDDVEKDVRWTDALLSQGLKVMTDMIPMIAGGNLGGGTSRGLSMLGTIIGTQAVMYGDMRKQYLAEGVDPSKATSAAFVQGTLVGLSESLFGIESKAGRALNGIERKALQNELRIISREVVENGITRNMTPKTMAKNLALASERAAAKGYSVFENIGEELIQEMVIEKAIEAGVREGVGLEQNEFDTNEFLSESLLTVFASGPLSLVTSNSRNNNPTNNDLFNFAVDNIQQFRDIAQKVIDNQKTEEDKQTVRDNLQVVEDYVEHVTLLNESENMDPETKQYLSSLQQEIADKGIAAKVSNSPKRQKILTDAKAKKEQEYNDIVEVIENGHDNNKISIGQLIRHDGKAYRVKELNKTEEVSGQELILEDPLDGNTLTLGGVDEINNVPYTEEETTTEVGTTETTDNSAVSSPDATVPSDAPSTTDGNFATNEGGNQEVTQQEGTGESTPLVTPTENTQTTQPTNEQQQSETETQPQTTPELQGETEVQPTEQNSTQPEEEANRVTQLRDEKVSEIQTITDEINSTELNSDLEGYNTEPRGNRPRSNPQNFVKDLDDGSTINKALQNLRRKVGRKLRSNDLPKQIPLEKRKQLVNSFNNKQDLIQERNTLSDQIDTLNEQIQNNANTTGSQSGTQQNESTQTNNDGTDVQGTPSDNRAGTGGEVQTGEVVQEQENVSGEPTQQGNDVPVSEEGTTTEGVNDSGNTGGKGPGGLSATASSGLKNLYGQFIERVLATEEIVDEIKEYVKNLAAPKIVISNEHTIRIADEILKNVNTPQDLIDMYALLKESLDSRTIRASHNVPFEVVAMMKLLQMAQGNTFYNPQLAADIYSDLGNISTNAGRLLQLFRTEILSEAGLNSIITSAELFAHNTIKKKKAANDIGINLGEALAEAEATMKKAAEEMAKGVNENKTVTETVNDVVNNPKDITNTGDTVEGSQTGDTSTSFKSKKYEAQINKYTEAAKKAMDNLKSQLSSGINPALFSFVKNKALEYFYRGLSKSATVKGRIEKILKKNNISLNDFNSVWDEVIADSEVQSTRRELLEAKLVESLNKPNSKKVYNDYMDQLSTRLIARFRRNNQGTAFSSPKKAAEKIQQLIQDRNLDAKTITEAINDVTNSSKFSQTEKAALKNFLEDTLAEIMEKPVGQSEVRKELKKDLEKKRTTIHKIINSSIADQNMFKQDLVDRLINEAGLSGADALAVKAAVEEIIEKEFADKMLQVARQAYLRGIGLEENVIKDRIKDIEKEIAEKNAEAVPNKSSIKNLEKAKKALEDKLNNLDEVVAKELEKKSFAKTFENFRQVILSGSLSNQDVQNLFSEKFGLTSMSIQEIQELRDLTEELDRAETNIEREKLLEKFADFYVKKAKHDVEWISLLHSYGYNSMLSGVTTGDTALYYTALNFITSAFLPDLIFAIPNILIDRKKSEAFLLATVDALEAIGRVGIQEAAMTVLKGNKKIEGDYSEAIRGAYGMDELELRFKQVMRGKYDQYGKILGVPVIGALTKFIAFSAVGTAIIGSRFLYAMDALLTPGMTVYTSRLEATGIAKQEYKRKGVKNADILARAEELMFNRDEFERLLGLEEARLDDKYSQKKNTRSNRIKKRAELARAEHSIKMQLMEPALKKIVDRQISGFKVTGPVRGPLGGLMNPRMDSLNRAINKKEKDATDYITGFTFMMLKFMTVPFLNLTGNSINFFLNSLPTGLFLNYDPKKELSINIKNFLENLPIGSTALTSTANFFNKRFNFPVTTALYKKSGRGYEWEVNYRTNREIQLRVLQATLPTTLMSVLAMMLFEKGDCDDDPTTICLKLREDAPFGVTGSGEGYGKDRNFGVDPYTIYVGDPDNPTFSFLYEGSPVLMAAFGPLGEMSDDYRRNINKGSDNLEWNPSYFANSYVTSVINGFGHAGVLSSTEASSKLLSSLANTVKSGVSEREKEALARNLRSQTQRGAGLFLPYNTNFWKKAEQMRRAFMDKPKQQLGILQEDESMAGAIGRYFMEPYANGFMISEMIGEDRLNYIGIPEPVEFRLKMAPTWLNDNFNQSDERMEEDPVVQLLHKYPSFDEYRMIFLPTDFAKTIITENSEQVVTGLSPREVTDAQNRAAELLYDVLYTNAPELDKMDEVNFSNHVLGLTNAVKGHMKGLMILEQLEQSGYPLTREVIKDLKVGKSKYDTSDAIPSGRFSYTKVLNYMIDNGLRIKDGELETGINYYSQAKK